MLKYTVINIFAIALTRSKINILVFIALKTQVMAVWVELSQCCHSMANVKIYISLSVLSCTSFHRFQDINHSDFFAFKMAKNFRNGALRWQISRSKKNRPKQFLRFLPPFQRFFKYFTLKKWLNVTEYNFLQWCQSMVLSVSTFLLLYFPQDTNCSNESNTHTQKQRKKLKRLFL